MNKGFDFPSLVVEKEFNLRKHLEKLGCTCTRDDEKWTIYETKIYDIESDSIVQIEFLFNERGYTTAGSQTLSLEITKKGKTVYNGLFFQSLFIFNVFMSMLFPSRNFIEMFDNQLNNREIELDFESLESGTKSGL